MAIILNSKSTDFEERFSALLGAKREADADVDETVRGIIDDVRARGDDSLKELTAKFDEIDLDQLGIRVPQEEIEAAIHACDSETLAALRLAHDRLWQNQEKLMPESWRHSDDLGVEYGVKWSPVDSVGVYAPGGLAAYPSSVLMNAVPAKVAGVGRIAMTVPMSEKTRNPLVLAAAHMAGVDEIYRVGGAQAVAALAYGTNSIAPVAKIVGPGNAYVAAAKRHVFGVVGIDLIAGPSEILVMADSANDPAWIAADLISQAEHDTAAQSILIADDANFAERVVEAVEGQLSTLPREEIARASWQNYGAIILVDHFSEASEIVNRIAPEHLELAVEEPEDLLKDTRNAGAVFLGRMTPEVIGDYVGGSNHILPTARSARFSSGLSVLDFLKRTSILKCGSESLKVLGPAAIALANAEGLDGHARSVSIRLN